MDTVSSGSKYKNYEVSSSNNRGFIISPVQHCTELSYPRYPISIASYPMTRREITILLLHGAYHPASVWDRLVPHLRGDGRRVLAPQLCFCAAGDGADERPITSWQTCIDQIRDILARETAAGRDVVLVNHSLAGIGGCSAVRGFTDRDPSALTPRGGGAGTGRVIGVVQVAAVTVRDAADKRALYQGRLGLPGAVAPGATGWKDPPAAARAAELFYGDLAPDDAARWARRLLRTSAYLDGSADGVSGGFADVPAAWYVVCGRDRAVPPAEQEEFAAVVREANPDTTVRRLDGSGHSPMLSRPRELAGIIAEAVEHCARAAVRRPGPAPRDDVGRLDLVSAPPGCTPVGP